MISCNDHTRQVLYPAYLKKQVINTWTWKWSLKYVVSDKLQ
jgi:hypothetical protein